MTPTVSLVLTINDRSPEVSKAVADSVRLPGNEVDETIVVLDRPTDEAARGAELAWGTCEDPNKVHFVRIEGPPGWRNPGPAWNAGFQAATSDLLYCISSDTTQAPGNIARARDICSNGNLILNGSVSCSCGPQGTEVNWGGQAPGNLFCDSQHPRPLGFIWCGPTKSVRNIGGYDPGFKDGFWHDDTDFFLRLWKSGADFTFNDSVSGTHLHHDRNSLSQEGIQKNTDYFIKKHGPSLLNPWHNLMKLVQYEPGKTTWRHL